MNNWLNNSTSLAYAITSLVLCGNLLFLWGTVARRAPRPEPR
jgi:hypothetical protein